MLSDRLYAQTQQDYVTKTNSKGINHFYPGLWNPNLEIVKFFNPISYV